MSTSSCWVTIRSPGEHLPSSRQALQLHLRRLLLPAVMSPLPASSSITLHSAAPPAHLTKHLQSIGSTGTLGAFVSCPPAWSH